MDLMSKRYFQSSLPEFILVLFAVFLSFQANSEAGELAPLFRSGSGDLAAGPARSVSIPPPSGWRKVSSINQDPLSLAQWTPRDPQCATGAASRLSVYAVDVGLQGPQKLLQKWFPEALKFQVQENERGFVIVRAEAEENRPQAVVAYPLSDANVTPLSGWIGGVNVVIVAESTNLAAEKLEEIVRKAIRSQVAVKAPSARAMDVPFILFNSQWHKSLSDRLEEGAKRGEPNALISKAYSQFNEADGFVPTGQNLLLKAADGGSKLARLDLIRLSRRGLLNVQIPKEKTDEWAKDLIAAGAEDARFWETENRPFDDDDAKIPQLDALKKLSACGQPEARRTWAKHLVQSFKASERYTGRNIVMSLMRNPPLEGTLPITTRVPRAVEAPAIETLKAAALLKTACPNEDEPEADLFASGDDFKIAKKVKRASAVKTEDEKEAEEFPELAEVQTLDKMVNSGSMKILKQAQKLACNWSGAEDDRNRLVIEIAARHNDGYGKWKRFRACDVLTETHIASFCREKELKQGRVNAESRYRDILVTAPAELRNAIANLRAKANAFHESILEKSYAEAKTPHEKSELDRMRRQMETEFLDLVAASLKQNLVSQIKDVVTGRRLLLLPPTTEETNFTLKRQPASAAFMKKELERLQARLQETMKSIEEADKEDIGKEFKKSLVVAHENWKAYRESYVAFATKLADQDGKGATTQAAADLWFHIQGIYYFEKIRDREISRTPPDDES